MRRRNNNFSMHFFSSYQAQWTHGAQSYLNITKQVNKCLSLSLIWHNKPKVITDRLCSFGQLWVRQFAPETLRFSPFIKTVFSAALWITSSSRTVNKTKARFLLSEAGLSLLSLYVHELWSGARSAQLFLSHVSSVCRAKCERKKSSKSAQTQTAVRAVCDDIITMAG